VAVGPSEIVSGKTSGLEGQIPVDVNTATGNLTSGSHLTFRAVIMEIQKSKNKINTKIQDSQNGGTSCHAVTS
jgi:hypothetical protein